MNRHLISALIATFGIASATCAFAQGTTPSQGSSQSNQQSETTPSSGADPESASSPHQRQATGETGASHEQMMKDCIEKERANDTSMSESKAKKACKEQMKDEMKSSTSRPKNY